MLARSFSERKREGNYFSVWAWSHIRSLRMEPFQRMHSLPCTSPRFCVLQWERKNQNVVGILFRFRLHWFWDVPMFQCSSGPWRTRTEPRPATRTPPRNPHCRIPSCPGCPPSSPGQSRSAPPPARLNFRAHSMCRNNFCTNIVKNF